jgi:predicted  nucleic acid-binding Zn-ribbon protein
MPTPKNSSSVYLHLHQVTSEKERLQKELQTLHDRSQAILLRLDELDRERTKLEAEATQSGITLDDNIEQLKADLNQSGNSSGSATKKTQTERKTKAKSISNAINPAFKSMSIDY